VIELACASAGIQKWKKWTNDQTDQDDPWDRDSGNLPCIIGLGHFPSATRVTYSADLTDGIAIADS